MPQFSMNKKIIGKWINNLLNTVHQDHLENIVVGLYQIDPEIYNSIPCKIFLHRHQLNIFGSIVGLITDFITKKCLLYK